MRYIARIDEQGRMDIPPQIREILNISPGGSVALEIDGKNVIMCYHENTCCFCGYQNCLEKIDDNYICGSCLLRLKEGHLILR